jgi:hypothetical protein
VRPARPWDARAHRWRPARDALWAVLDGRVAPGARVLVAGAGNACDLPLTRLLRRTDALTLLDVEARPVRAALAREPRGAGARVLVEDVPAGAADRVVRAAAAGRAAPVPAQADVAEPLGGAPYDVVVGDLLYTQLLHPSLTAAGLPAPRLDAAMLTHAQRLTDLAVARMHASLAPGGVAVHVHDVLGWWAGHQQPATLAEALRMAPSRALRAAARANGPRGADLPGAIRRVGAVTVATALWRWPFAPGVDYLVAAFVARPTRAPPPPPPPG